MVDRVPLSRSEKTKILGHASGFTVKRLITKAKNKTDSTAGRHEPTASTQWLSSGRRPTRRLRETTGIASDTEIRAIWFHGARCVYNRGRHVCARCITGSSQRERERDRCLSVALYQPWPYFYLIAQLLNRTLLPSWFVFCANTFFQCNVDFLLYVLDFCSNCWHFPDANKALWIENWIGRGRETETEKEEGQRWERESDLVACHSKTFHSQWTQLFTAVKYLVNCTHWDWDRRRADKKCFDLHMTQGHFY